MAEGGYDPMDETTDKTPLNPNTGDDDNDVDWVAPDWDTPLEPKDPDRTQPFEPDASSTPYHEGEEHEMSSLSQEQSGMAYAPGEPAWNALTYLYPDASATELEAFMDPTTHRLKIKITGAGKKAYFLLTEDKSTKQQKLNPQLTKEIRKALGESASDQLMTLQEQRDRNAAEIRVRLQEREQLDVQVQELKETRKEMDAINNQIRRLENDIHALEDKAGPFFDEATIQRFKDEKRALEAEHQRKKEQYDQTQVKAKETLQLQTEINDLKLANRDIDRQINKLGVKPTKMFDELVQEKAELEKRLAEKRRVLEDENASPSEREAAQKQVDTDEWALERVNENIEREEQKLPLREQVKNIFKKYGWTLQAVALAVGIVLSALALAATNGLKAGTKAIGNGLKAIGQKLGSLLPGLIGSIVSYIFKAAGSVLSFLGEHAWLLILAVVAFFMERLLKKRRR